MGRILNIWRGWSTTQRLALVGGLVVLVAGGALAAYLVLKREGDRTCPPPCELETEPKLEPKKTLQPVNWPVYGYNDQRTRYFPSDRVNPPFRGSSWSIQLGKLLEFSPIVSEGRLFFTDKSATVYSLEARTGKVNWKRKVGSLSAASPAFEDGRLFVVSLTPGDIQALNPETGKVQWERDLGARSETSPLVFGDKVIVGNEAGTVFALNVKTGDTEWSVPSAGAVKGGVAVDNGTVYFGNYAGEVFAVDASNGKVRWQTGTQGSSFGRAGRIYSTPAVGYGRVYVGSIDSRVYSFDAEDGSLAWSQSTGAEVYPGPVLAEVPGGPPTVYVGSADKYFYALDAGTGSVRWKEFTGGIILGAASVIGDVAYVGVIGPKNGTIGYDADNGDRIYSNELGEYNPAITDGKRLFITGYSGIRAFLPKLNPGGAKKGQGKDKKDGKKGGGGSEEREKDKGGSGGEEKKGGGKKKG
jgi:outer membrane protein assembly factor BamB